MKLNNVYKKMAAEQQSSLKTGCFPSAFTLNISLVHLCLCSYTKDSIKTSVIAPALLLRTSDCISAAAPIKCLSMYVLDDIIKKKRKWNIKNSKNRKWTLYLKWMCVPFWQFLARRIEININFNRIKIDIPEKIFVHPRKNQKKLKNLQNFGEKIKNQGPKGHRTPR